MTPPPDPQDDDLQLAPLTPAVPGPPPSPAYAPTPRPVTYAPPPDGGPAATGPDRTDGGTPAETDGGTLAETDGGKEAVALGNDAVDPAEMLGPSRRRNRLTIVVVAVVAVLVAAAAVVLAAGASGGRETEEREPDAASDPATGADPDAAATDDASTSTTGGTTRSDDDPAVAATEALIAAVEADDCAGIIGRLTPESYGPRARTADEAMAECEAGRGVAASLAAADFGAVTLVDAATDRATVSVVVTLGGQANERGLEAHRIDGEWRLDVRPLTTSSSPRT
jgi:hypothetical protein